MTPANVVKVTVFLTDRSWISAYRTARGAFFPADPPASTLLFVAGLADPAFGFEIEAEASVYRNVSRNDQLHVTSAPATIWVTMETYLSCRD